MQIVPSQKFQVLLKMRILKNLWHGKIPKTPQENVSFNQHMKDNLKKLFLLKTWLSSSMLTKLVESLQQSQKQKKKNKQKQKQATTKEEKRLSKKYTQVIIIANNKGGKSIQKVTGNWYIPWWWLQTTKEEEKSVEKVSL